MTLAVRTSEGVLEGLPQDGSVLCKATIIRFRSAAFRAPAIGRTSLGEELLLLELDPLPRRIAEHDVEAAPLEDSRKLKRPVKEGVLRGSRLDEVPDWRPEVPSASRQ